MQALYFEDDINVSTYDIDFIGHVSNIVYLRWLEDMRLKMFNQYCPLKNFIDQGVTPVLIETEIKYKKSIRLFEQPICKMWVSHLGKASLIIDAEIFVQGELATMARFTGAFVDMKTLRPIRVPQEFRNAVERSDREAASVIQGK